MKLSHGLVAAALATSFVASASAASAEVLILRSVGPSANKYKAGQRLADNARIVLSRGDTLAVLRKGGTRVFRGPGRFDLAAAPTRSSPNSPGPRGGTGVVRGDGGVSDRPLPGNLWHVDATLVGRACFIAGTQVVLWRPYANRSALVTIRAASGATTRLTWPARANTLPLPQAAAASGSRISYVPDGAVAATQVSLAEVKIDAANRDAVAPALVAARCRHQLEHFIALHLEKAP